MKLELKTLIIAVLAVVLAIPVASALHHRTHQLKLEKSQNNTLQIQLNNVQKQLQLKNTQIQKKQDENKKLQKQLQAKRETQATLATIQAPTAPVAVSGAGNCAAYSKIVAQYNWDTHIALAVMKAESRCNPTATSPTCDHGLMQINCVHADMVGGNLTRLNDPATNIRVAYAIYKSNGWRPWTTFTSGAYLAYL